MMWLICVTECLYVCTCCCILLKRLALSGQQRAFASTPCNATPYTMWVLVDWCLQFLAYIGAGDDGLNLRAEQ